MARDQSAAIAQFITETAVAELHGDTRAGRRWTPQGKGKLWAAAVEKRFPDTSTEERVRGCMIADELLTVEINEELMAYRWRPIEEAPKDGTIILIYQPAIEPNESGRAFTARWFTDPKRCERLDVDGYWAIQRNKGILRNATHFMDLPPPPVSALIYPAATCGAATQRKENT